jgi:hypothetical protein
VDGADQLVRVGGQDRAGVDGRAAPVLLLPQPGEGERLAIVEPDVVRLLLALVEQVVLWKECNDPPLYLERRPYLGAIQDALAGVEAARVVLAKARQRLEREGGHSRL